MQCGALGVVALGHLRLCSGQWVQCRVGTVREGGVEAMAGCVLGSVAMQLN